MWTLLPLYVQCCQINTQVQTTVGIAVI